MVLTHDNPFFTHRAVFGVLRLAGLVEDADIHHPGMQVDAAVKWVLSGVESHWGRLLIRDHFFSTLSISRWCAGEGTSISIEPLQLPREDIDLSLLQIDHPFAQDLLAYVGKERERVWKTRRR